VVNQKLIFAGGGCVGIWRPDLCLRVRSHPRAPIVLPCRRIVGASDSLVGGGGLERKEHLLRLEGEIL
jgi:hypothetical protein